MEDRTEFEALYRRLWDVVKDRAEGVRTFATLQAD